MHFLFQNAEGEFIWIQFGVRIQTCLVCVKNATQGWTAASQQKMAMCQERQSPSQSRLSPESSFRCEGAGALRGSQAEQRSRM